MSSLMLPRYTLSVSKHHGHDILHAEGRIGDKPYLVTIGTGASVPIARPEVTAGLPERDLPTWCASHTHQERLSPSRRKPL